VATIYFAPDTGAIDEQGRAIVSEVAAAVQSRGGVIRLIGFPANDKSSGDSGGATAVSRMQKLAGAFRQAQAVANELIGKGIDPQLILVEARAESEAKGGEGDRPRADVFLEN
jgi:outer membrane protein OmpA-like peptidoglycan-associated protein